MNVSVTPPSLLGLTQGRINAAVMAMLLLLPVYAHLTDNVFVLTLATKAAIFALAAVGLNIALGLGGMVSFGHAAFFGLGGYVTGILATHHLNAQPLLGTTWVGSQDMLVIWPVVLLCSAIAAALIGVLSVRTKGVYFIMVTLAFAQMMYYLAIAWPAYGGEDGLSFYVRNTFAGVNTMQPLNFYLIVLAILSAALVLFSRLANSSFGLVLRAIRQNPQRVQSVGIAPFRVQLAAFVISAVITGLAGSLYADLNRFVSPQSLSWHFSGEIIVFVILGGVGRLFGPVIGAFVFVLLEHWLGGVSEHWQFFLGLALLGVVMFARGGVLGLLLRGERT